MEGFSSIVYVWETEFWSFELYLSVLNGNHNPVSTNTNTRAFVCVSGFYSCSAQCWVQTLICQTSCFTAGPATFMLYSTLTKRSELTRWMRAPLQRWDIQTPACIFSFLNLNFLNLIFVICKWHHRELSEHTSITFLSAWRVKLLHWNHKLSLTINVGGHLTTYW